MFVDRDSNRLPGLRAGPGLRDARPVLLLLLVALAARAPGFAASVIDPDEGLYVVQAAAWLRGGWPYLAVWDMHPPGAPALLVPALALVPDPVLAMRLLGVLAVAATAAGLRGLAIALGAGAGAGFAAGLLYIAHTTVLGGLATNTEILFAPFVVSCARLLLAEALRDAPPRILPVLGAGLAAGMAVWIKQVAALEASALWLTLVAVALAAGRLRPPRVAALALVFAVGAAVPTLPVAAGYAAAGAFAPWLQANILVPFAYGTEAADSPGLRRGVLGALDHLLWPGLAALGVLAAPGARRIARLLLPWLAGTAFAVAVPQKYFDHYFLVPLPPICLLAAIGLAALGRQALRARCRRGGVAAMVAVLAALPLSEMLLPRLAAGIGLRGPDPARRVAALAAAALRPGQALFVANWHPVTYALAGATPPTRFAFPGHLAGRFAAATGADADAELARVLALPPGVIVVAPAFWPGMRPEARAMIEAALAEGYDRLATVPDGSGPVDVWRLR